MRHLVESGAAKSGAVDTDLVELVQRWPDLDEITRHAIMRMARGD